MNGPLPHWRKVGTFGAYEEIEITDGDFLGVHLLVPLHVFDTPALEETIRTLLANRAANRGAIRDVD